MFKKLAIAAAAATPIAYYYYTHQGGAAPTPKLEGPALTESRLPSRNYLYIQHIGNYGKVDDTFKIVSDDLKKFTKLNLKNAQFAAIYYDNPMALPASANLRGVVGVMFDLQNRLFADDFIRYHPEYEIKELPAITTISAKVPDNVGLDASPWVIGSLFPKIQAYFKEKDLKGLEKAPLLEVFDVQDDKVKGVQIHIPYGSNIDSLWLTKAPEYKPTK